MPERRSRTWLQRGAILLTMIASFATTAAAQSTSVTRFMNTYFLPPTAQVTTLSGLIFGVVLPFGIVLTLIYIMLDNISRVGRGPSIRQRQVAALSVMLSLFIIPSGGYRFISGLLLGVFGLGNVSGVGGISPVTIPGVQNISIPLLVSLTVVTLLALIFHRQSENFGFTEYLVTSAVGIGVYIMFGGSTSFVGSIAGFLILLAVGFVIMTEGLGGNRISGSIVGLIGMFVVAYAIASFDLLPANVRAMGGILAGLGIVALVWMMFILIGAVIAGILAKRWGII